MSFGHWPVKIRRAVTSVSEIPQTQYVCDGTGEEFSLLNPHLEVSLRPVRQVLQSEATPLDEDADENDMEGGDPNIYLATKAGRGVDLKFKDFDAARKWFDKRKGYRPKLQLSHEPPYEPADEIVADDEDGE